MDEILIYFSNHINLLIIAVLIMTILIVTLVIWLLIENKKIEKKQRKFLVNIISALIEESRCAGLKEIKRIKQK